ncbi:MAG: hypothetical protein WCR55_14890 [Lentisphaerota bacterium]
MEINEKLMMLWDHFDQAWNKYLQDYDRRIESIREINQLIDTFDSGSPESKLLQGKILNQDDLDNEEQVENDNYHIALVQYLRLAYSLGNKNKNSIIKERLIQVQNNLENIFTLNHSLDKKQDAFMKHHFKRE